MGNGISLDETQKVLQNGFMKNLGDVWSTQCAWHDVLFTVGNDKTKFYGIKALFAIHSPVFKAMLFGQMKESQSQGLDNIVTINIPDVTSSAFQFLILFIFGATPPMPNKDIVDVLYMAKKYLIKPIEDACMIAFQWQLQTMDDFLYSMNRLHSLGMHDILAEMLQSMSLSVETSVDIINSNMFVQLAPSILRVFLQSDNFGVDENIIFEKCLEWAEYQSKNNKIKGIGNDDNATTLTTAMIAENDEKNLEINFDIDNENECAKTKEEFFNLVKYDIRFPIMNDKYFNTKVIDSGLLTDNENLNIIRYIHYSSDSNKIKENVETIWNCKARNFIAKLDSNLKLTCQEFSKLKEWIPNEYENCKWNLLYRASQHNFEASKFHEKCDGKYPTVVIVKPKQYDNIFGGFAQAPWNSNGGWICDSNAFVFLLRRDANAPQASNNANRNIQLPAKWNIKDAKHAMFGYGGNKGPAFGAGHDFVLTDKCHQRANSYSNLGSSFDAPHDNVLLAASQKFLVDEYEVFHIQPPS